MRKGYVLVTLAMLALIGHSAYQHSEVAGYQNVAPERAAELVDEGALLLDVRTVEEFEAGHVDGAVNVPVEDPNELAERWEELPRDRAIVVYCQTGRRSVTASELLAENGFDEVYNVVGGYERWRAEGLPTGASSE